MAFAVSTSRLITDASRPRTACTRRLLVGLPRRPLAVSAITRHGLDAGATRRRREGYVEVPGARLFYLDGGGLGPRAGAAPCRHRQRARLGAPMGAARRRRLPGDRLRPARLRPHHHRSRRTAWHRRRRSERARRRARPRPLPPRRHRRWRHRRHRLRAGLSRSAAQPRGRQQPRRCHRPVLRRARPAAASQGVRRPAARPARARSRVSGRQSRGHRSLAGAGAPQSGAGRRRAAAAGAGSASRSRCSKGLRVPTLLLTGGADMYTPPAALQLFASRIPGATSVVLPDVGHSAFWEQPEAFNRAVLDFVRRY